MKKMNGANFETNQSNAYEVENSGEEIPDDADLVTATSGPLNTILPLKAAVGKKIVVCALGGGAVTVIPNVGQSLSGGGSGAAIVTQDFARYYIAAFAVNGDITWVANALS